MSQTIRIEQFNSKCGSNKVAGSLEEARKIVNELINEETVSITINQKECVRTECPVTANGDKFSGVNSHCR